MAGQFGWHMVQKDDPRFFVPQILTILTPDEQKLSIDHRGEFKNLEIDQIEPITT